MIEHFAELGIGETRIIRVEDGHITHAWLDCHERLQAGTRVKLKIAQRKRQDNRALGCTADGQAVLLRRLPKTASEGSEITAEITRAPILETGRGKPAQALYTQEPARSWSKIDQLRERGVEPKIVRQFPVEGWEEIAELATGGKLEFDGGTLVLTATPAMTLIDVDGHLSPRELALRAIPSIASSIRLLEVSGSIGIDFPTLEAKVDRRAVDEALASELHDFAHERTAMNGFGFVQIVSRMDGPSMLHRYSASRAAACAKLLLRRAERIEGPGALLMTVHPALKSELKPDWLDELARRTGKEVRIETNSGLALEASQAQIIAS